MKQHRRVEMNKLYWEMMARMDWKTFLGSSENVAFFENELRDLDAQIEKLKASRKK